MAGSLLSVALPELVRRGLLAETPAAVPLPRGNRDRRADVIRESWIVHRRDGSRVKFTLGSGVVATAATQLAFAQECPELVAAPIFAESVLGVEAMAEPYFDGCSLETAWRESQFTRTTCDRALTLAREKLERTTQTSTTAARAAEWQGWTERLLALSLWSPEMRSSLAADVLPALARRLDGAPPATRWTNGDFTASNLLLDADGTSRLIDHEFARRTHFFGEDVVRFNVLARAAFPDEPPLLDEPEDADFAWHLFFWLRQVQLEVEQNSPGYLARMQSGRLALIWHLARRLVGHPLTNGSLDDLAIDHRLEQARWLPQHSMTVLLGGWCRVAGDAGVRSMVALGEGRRMAAADLTNRPDVQEHFPHDPRSARSGFALHVPLRRLETGLTLCAALENGALLPVATLDSGDLPRGVAQFEEYPAWADRHDPDPPARPATLPMRGPMFSVLVPVHRPPRDVLVECLESVRRQHYPHWELCLVDDGMPSSEITSLLRGLAREDPRIRVTVRRARGGISRATNDALAAAQGEYVVLLDHDDILRPHALAEFAAALARDSHLDVLYSDEDKLDEEGRRVVPLPKPDFSPEFVLGVMYIGHALCVRTSLARAAGGFDPSFDGVQDYDFFLRLTERTKRIGHVPRILYHWRQSAASSALVGNVKGDMDALQRRAVESHLRRRGDHRRVEALTGHRIRLVPDRSKPSSRCGFILAWAEGTPVPDELWEALAALAAPVWPALGITPPAAIQTRRSSSSNRFSLLRDAARSGEVDVVMLLGAPIRATTPDWISHLTACARLGDSGAVAPLLLDREGRVFASGWTIAAAEVRPIMRGYASDGDGAHGSLPCTREVGAVSDHCLAIRAELVRDGPAARDWLDLCQGLRARGLHNRVCPAARVSLSTAGPEAMGAPATASPDSDPYFNPHFDPHHADYRLAWPPTHFAPERSAFQWHLDVPPRLVLPDGGLRVLGWIVHTGGKSVTVRAHVAGITWSVPVGESRPDVARLVSRPRAGNSGFRLNLRVPSGRHVLQLVAATSDGQAEQLWAGPVEVSQHALLRRAWKRGPDCTASYQMLAAPSHAPKPLRPERFNRRAGGPTRPRLAIVTPSYNQAAFLGETMRSVLGQEAAVDYVVQDGGSTDGSKALIEAIDKGDWRPETGIKESEHQGPRSGVGGLPPASRLRSPSSPTHLPRPVSGLPPPRSSPRLVAWASEPDKGQADAIAKGFAKTSGEPDDIMAWINSDDFYVPGALRYVADYFARHPEVDALYGHRILVDEQSAEVGRWFLPQHSDEMLRVCDFVPQETLFWRRRIWDKVGGLDTSFQFAMDWDLLLRFAGAGARIVRVPYFLACFRVHPAQKTSAAMHSIGQKEIDRLRTRTHGREIPSAELERDPRLLRYLRRSAFIEWLWSLGIRAP